MKKSGLFISMLIVLASFTHASAQTFFLDSFNSAPVLSSTQAPNAWYTDRYAPAAFEQAMFEGQNRLMLSIGVSGQAANRPAPFASQFYNTQGRKFDVNIAQGASITADLYIPLDWQILHRRADVWATGFDATNAVTAYGILGFANTTGGNPVLRAYNSNDGTWHAASTPIVYGQWYTLKMELAGTALNYYINGSLVYSFVPDDPTVTLGNMMLQAYNFGDATLAADVQSFEPYDVYWDNVGAVTGIHNTTQNTFYTTLPAAVAAAVDGDQIALANGTYPITATLNFNHEISITGESEAGTIIDATGTPASAWSINPNKSNSSMSNLTILPNAASGGYTVHVGDNMVPVVISNISLSHITILGAKKTPFDINGVTNLNLSYLTAKNTASGNGISLSGCENVTANHLTTSGNSWGGVAIYVSKAPGAGVNRGSNNVTIDATTSAFGEVNKIYAQDEAGLFNTNITVTGFEYAVKNLAPAVAGYTFYKADKATAMTQAFSFANPLLSTVKILSSGRYYVDAGLSIQTAINASDAGATVEIEAGEYDESVTIQKDILFAGVAPILPPPPATPQPGLVVRDLTIDNDNGFTLLGMLGVSGTLTFVKGNIYAAAPNSMTLGTSATITGETGAKMVLGELVVRRTSVPAGTVETFGGVGFEASNIPADLGLSRLVRMTGTGVELGNGFNSVKRVWEVYVTNPAAVNVKFSWFDTEDNGNTFTPLSYGAVFSSIDGDMWSIVGSGADVSGSPVRSITVTLAAGTYFTTGSPDAAMPVELSAFTGTASGRKVQLAWSTATEKNNYGFEVERRIAGAQAAGQTAQWQKVAFVEGAGNSNTPRSYGYTDAVTAGTYEYRLKQVDRDGSYEYSKTIEATVAFTAEDYAVTQNYPNPFNPTTTIRFAVRTAQHAVVKIYNAIGQEIRTLYNDMAQSETMYSVTFDATGLPSGTYYYMLRTADRNEVKRMLLVK